MCIRARANRLEPKRLAFVKNKAAGAPWLFLVEAQKNRKTGLRVEPDVLILSLIHISIVWNGACSTVPCP